MRKKSGSVIVFFELFVVSFLLVLPSSQIMAAWECDYITVESSSCTSCHTGPGIAYDVTLIRVHGTPNDVEEGGMFIGYDTSEMSYYVYDIADSLIEAYYTTPYVEATETAEGLSLYFSDLDSNVIPAGVSDLLVTLAFINNIHPSVPATCLTDFVHDIEGWC